jgi:hypothetical protein
LGELGSSICGSSTGRLLSCTWLVHVDFALGMLIDTKTDGISVEIVHGVEVLEEGISDEEEILVLSW